MSLFCHQCRRPLKVAQKGVFLIELDHAQKYITAEPNVIWQGSILQCPECKLKVIKRNGGMIAAAFENGFNETLGRIRNTEGNTVLFINPERQGEENRKGK